MDPKAIQSKHFTIEPMAEGVYGAIHHKDGWAIANAGIVDLGEGCLVFDTTLTPTAGLELRQAAENLTGQPVRYVVNSHYHNDHIWGNQVFGPEVSFVSSDETRRLIGTKGQAEYDWYLKNSGAKLKELRAQRETSTDEAELEAIENWITYYQGLAESMPDIEVHLPDLTFRSELMIYGANRQVELVAFAQAHTAGDTILHLPAEGIIFAGDLLFVQSHPYLADGDPNSLLSALEAIQSMAPRALLPGHGQLGGPRNLERMIQYVLDCQQMARELVEQGIDPEEERSFPIPNRYISWDYPNFFQSNMAHFIKRTISES